MQNGYPFRLPHAEFRAQFHMLVSGRQVDKRVLFVDPAPTRPGPPAERSGTVDRRLIVSLPP